MRTEKQKAESKKQKAKMGAAKHFCFLLCSSVFDFQRRRTQ